VTVSYNNRYSGAITITPPLIRSQIDAAPETRDALLRVTEERSETPGGYSATVVAGAIVGPDEPCSGYQVEKEIAALARYCESLGRTVGGYIQVDWDPGFGDLPSRYYWRGGQLAEIKPTMTWPEEDPAERPHTLGDIIEGLRNFEAQQALDRASAEAAENDVKAGAGGGDV
jgi:hypothetical protein